MASPGVQKKRRGEAGANAGAFGDGNVSFTGNFMDEAEVKISPIEELLQDSLFYTHNMFLYNQSLGVLSFSESTKLKLKIKTNDLYKTTLDHLHNRKEKADQEEEGSGGEDSVEIRDESEDSLDRARTHQAKKEPESQIQKLLGDLPTEKKKKLNDVPLKFLRSFKTQD